MKSKPLGAVATLLTVGGVIAVESLPARAATTACGSQCGSVFARELGLYAEPSVVEAVLDGVAQVGSKCSIIFGSGVASAAPGSGDCLLAVTDVE